VLYQIKGGIGNKQRPCNRQTYQSVERQYNIIWQTFRLVVYETSSNAIFCLAQFPFTLCTISLERPFVEPIFA